jgi:hypothetical protein
MKRIKGTAIALAVIIGMCALAPVMYAGPCEDAFRNCVNDPVMMILLTGKTQCGLGYLFCKKYVEPFVK